LTISHHDVVHVDFEDAADIHGFVSMMQLNGFSLPTAAPDRTFKPQPWLVGESTGLAKGPFEFAEGEAIVPWPVTPRAGTSKICRLEHPAQFRAWEGYWMWISHVVRYSDLSGRPGSFFERLLDGLEPWKEVLIAWAPYATDECLCFLREERAELIEWLEKCSGGDCIRLIPEHGREFLQFYPKHRRVDGVFSEPARLDRWLALLAGFGEAGGRRHPDVAAAQEP
jgi:hypothetical protein